MQTSIAETTTTRQPGFVAAASEAGVSPFMLGVLDAECGNLCLPDIYYIHQGDKLEYCEGYESVAGRTLLSGQILGDATIFIEACEYEEDIADRDFWAHGC